MSHCLLGAVLTALFFSLSGCGSAGGGGEILYVAIGASDATGIGASPLTNGYVFRIEDSLDQCSDTALDNLGIPGAKVREMKNIEVPIAETLDPDLITVFAGGNDLTQGTSVEDFSDDLGRILSELSEKTDAFIVISNLPDMTLLPRYQEEPDKDVTLARINAYNQVIQTQANRFGLPVVNLFAQPLGNFLVSDDGFHPNDAGHQLIANLFLEIIRPVYCIQES